AVRFAERLGKRRLWPRPGPRYGSRRSARDRAQKTCRRRPRPGSRDAEPGRAVGRDAEARRACPGDRRRARDRVLRRADHRPRPARPSMAKPQARYACQQCGALAPKWTGRCEACDAWNSLVEEVPRSAPPKSLGRATSRRGGPAIDFVGLRGETAGPPRRLTGIAELDRVCGGGLVPGSTILVGGDPGIGKSTLLLQ